MFIFSILSAFLILLDYLTKQFVYQNLAFGKSIVVVPGLVRFLYLKNTGAAFSILHNQQWLLILISLAISLFIIYYVWEEKCINKMQVSGLIFLFSGTIGNLLNRVFSGGVIDFIDLFGRWPVFNLADIFINIGIFLIIISILSVKKVKR